MITLLAPKGVTQVSHNKENYSVVDGKVEVPDLAAAELIGSHGFMDPQAPHPAAAPTVGKPSAKETEGPAHDDDLITNDEATPSAADFSAGLSQAEMKQYLRYHNVAVPKTGTVRDLRKLVEDTWTEHEGKEPVAVNDAGEHAAAIASEPTKHPLPEGRAIVMPGEHHPGFTPPHESVKLQQPAKPPVAPVKK